MEEVVYLQLNDTVVELLRVEKPTSRTINPWQIGYRAIALEVEDMDKVINYLRDKGVEITWGPGNLRKI